ncbi:ribonuclease H-like domain-containing protein [Tanacetum coccineum]
MVTAPTDGQLPLCERCFTRHVGQCKIKCHKCGKVGHKARYCKEKTVATGANTQPVWTCYDCGEQGHTRNRCSKKVKQEEVKEVHGRAYAIKDAEPQGPNVVTVILNGNKVLKRTVREVEQEYEPTSAKEKQDMRNEMKARGTMLMALQNKDQLKLHSYKDAKLLMEAIEKRCGGNKESKKLEIQGEVITQEDMNLKLLRSLPSKWKTHDLILRNKDEIETISLDDLYNNLKIYEPKLTVSSSTSQNLQNVAFVSSNSNDSNTSTNEADNTAYGVSDAHTQSNHVNPTSGDNLSDVVICAFLASQPNSSQLAQEDLEQIDPDDLEEMDLHWEMAMLTIRAKRFIKRTCRKLDVNGQRVEFDSSKVECYNCHFARECRAPRNQENRGRENSRRTVTVESLTENALVAQDRIGGYDRSYQAEEEHPTNYELMAYTSSGSSSSLDSEVDSCSKSCVKAYATLKEQYEIKLRDNALVENKKKLEKAKRERDELKLTLEKFQNSSKSFNNLLESQEYNKSKSDNRYYAVPLPYTGKFIPFKPDLTFMDEIVKSDNMDVITIVTPSNVKKVESNHESADVKNKGDAVEPKTVRKNSFRPPVIED